MAFYRGGGLAFSHLCGFFVEFPAMDFGEYSGFLTGPLKASQCEIEWFIFSYFYRGHIVCRSCFLSFHYRVGDFSGKHAKCKENI